MSQAAPSFTRAETALAFRAAALDGDLTRKRMRERYLSIQFPDFVAMRGKPALIVRLARELFDEGERRLAVEVLTLAIQETPRERAFPLALLELAYLAEESALFSAAADYFRREFPQGMEQPVISRMGGLVAPQSGAFYGRARDPNSEASRYRIPGWSLLGSPSSEDAAPTEFRSLLLDGPGA